MSSVRRPHGRLFQIRGPAAPKLLSPKLLSVHGPADIRHLMRVTFGGSNIAVQRIRGYFYNEMRYINLRFTYLLTYFHPGRR